MAISRTTRAIITAVCRAVFFLEFFFCTVREFFFYCGETIRLMARALGDESTSASNVILTTRVKPNVRELHMTRAVNGNDVSLFRGSKSSPQALFQAS